MEKEVKWSPSLCNIALQHFGSMAYKGKGRIRTDFANG